MERRRFLQLGAAAGAAVAGGTGCSTMWASAAATTPDLPDMESFFGKLDAAMAAIAGGTPLGDFAAKRCAANDPAPARDGRDADPPKRSFAPGERLLMQKALRSLTLVGAVHELPEHARQHPGMLARLKAGMPEMDDAVFGMTQLLADLSRTERVELRRRLQREPDLPMRMAEALDAQAKRHQIPLERRLRLRRLASHVAWRLRNQPPDILLDEYVTKVRKVAARNGYDEQLQRQLAARASTAALLSYPAAISGAAPGQGQPAQPATSPLPGPPVTSPSTAAPSPAPAPAPAEPHTVTYPNAPYSPTPVGEAEECGEGDDAGSSLVTAGGIVMGVGAAIGAIGGVILAAEAWPGVIFLTVGGVVLLTGLVILIVGAAIGSDDESECSS